MTTYLTKHEDGKVFHFRVTVTNTGVDVVQGQFYKSISKVGNATGKNNLPADATELINAKIADGFKIAKFVESKENNYHVYDKAKYHYDGDFPNELDEFQSFVHTGMYIGWLIDCNLIDEEFFFDSQDGIADFKSRKITGPQFYEQYIDGVFLIEEVSELGNRFSFEYFDFDTGKYLEDYQTTLAEGLPTLYHVQDTWDNYEKIRQVIDTRFAKWNENRRKKSWWEIW